jgi:hypothetical protein
VSVAIADGDGGCTIKGRRKRSVFKRSGRRFA